MILETVKTLLGIETDEQDAVLQIMIEDAKAAVRDYCCRKDYPEQLEHVIRELVVNAFNSNNEGNVTSVKRGDTQISYAEPITGAVFTDRQRSVMNRYKVIRMD